MRIAAKLCTIDRFQLTGTLSITMVSFIHRFGEWQPYSKLLKSHAFGLYRKLLHNVF